MWRTHRVSEEKGTVPMSGVVGLLERPIRFGVLIAVGLALIAAAFAAGLGLSGTFANQHSPDEVHACVSAYTGAMRYVWNPSQCTAGEYPVSWNGGNGLAEAIFAEASINAPGGSPLNVGVTCDTPGAVLLDAGFSTNPQTNVETGALGPTSTNSWTAILRPAQNTSLTISALCAVPSGGAGALTAGPQITIEEIEE